MALDDLDNMWVTDLVFTVDAETAEILDATGDIESCLGLVPDELVGTPLFGSVHRDDLSAAMKAFEQTRASGRATWEGRVRHVDGSFVEYAWEGRLGTDGSTIFARSRDITRAKATLADLRFYEQLADLTTDLLVVVDEENRIRRANPASLEAMGSSLEEVVDTDVADQLGARRDRALRGILDEVRREQVHQRHEIEASLGDALRLLDVHFAPAPEGGIVFLSCRDVTDERSLQKELVVRASTDGLTRLANRATLLEALEADLASGRPAALVMLDLDGFKQINDTLGHAAGDMLLIEVGRRLDGRTRGVDIVSRFGGDEFAVLLRRVPDSATLSIVAEKLRDCFHAPFDVFDRPVHITASIGASIGRGATHTAEQLLLEADIATYAAKDSGNDRARVFDELLRASTDFAHALEDHLRRVLTAAEFELDVVPVNSLDGVLVGVGVVAPALAITGERRWNASSMAVAKKLGLLGPLSIRMARESVSGLSGWLQRHPDVPLDIVYDVVEIEVDGFADQLLTILDEFAVPPNQLVVSLAGVAVQGIQAVDLDVIGRLRNAGIRVSLAASRADTKTLEALRLRCIDRIDVDTARVALAPEGSIDRLIATTVFDIADRLGTEIVADSSFAPDVVDTVSMFPNCAPIGLVYGRPVPLAEFIAEPSRDLAATPESVDP